MQSALLAATLLLLLVLPTLSQSYNTSLCTDIVIGDLHYYINANSNNLNIVRETNDSSIIYNLCKQVEVYCPYLNAVITASMVLTSPANRTCTPYRQTAVGLINPTDVSSGITVTYLSSANQSVVINTPCNGAGIGCPAV